MVPSGFLAMCPFFLGLKLAGSNSIVTRSWFCCRRSGGAAHGCKGHSNLHGVVVYGDAVDQTEINNVDWYLGIVAVPEHFHYSVDGKTFPQALRPKFIMASQPNRAIRSTEPPRRSPDYKKWTSGVSKFHTCMSHEK